MGSHAEARVQRRPGLDGRSARPRRARQGPVGQGPSDRRRRTRRAACPTRRSNERLRRAIPDVRFTPIDAAIDALYDWYAANLRRIDRSALLVDK